MATIIGFDRKGDLVDAAMLCQPHVPLTVLLWEELQIALLQPARGQRTAMFINVIVQLLAQHLRLEASRRLMMDTLHVLFKRRRPHGTWPRLSEWIELIENINAPRSRAWGSTEKPRSSRSRASSTRWVMLSTMPRAISSTSCARIEAASSSARTA